MEARIPNKSFIQKSNFTKIVKNLWVQPVKDTKLERFGLKIVRILLKKCLLKSTQRKNPASTLHNFVLQIEDLFVACDSKSCSKL